MPDIPRHERRVIPMVIDQFYPHIGGAERQALVLSQELRHRGYRPIVVTRWIDPALPRASRCQGIPVLRLPGARPTLFTRLVAGLRAVLIFRRLRHRILAVHLHGQNPFELGAALAARALGLPSVTKINVSEFLGPISQRARADATGPSSSVRRWMMRHGRGLLLRCTDAVAALNEEIAATAAQMTRRPIRAIPNGIPVDVFPPTSEESRAASRRRLGVAPRTVVFLYVGRLAPQKNLETLLEAWRSVVADRASLDRVLWLVGAPEDASYGERIWRAAEQLPGVKLWASQRNPLPFYEAADVFVLTSLREGVSNALLEALATGLPVVVSDIPGNQAVLKSVGGGWSCPCGDATAWAYRLIEAGAASARWTYENRAALHGAIKRHFALEAVAEQYLRLYHEIDRTHTRSSAV